jgi:hypothetical protein
MDPKSLAIPLAFILLAAVLCWQLIGAKGKWWLKLLAIVVVPGFGLAVWASIGSYKGWPTSDEPPEKALILASSVREPDPRTGDPGAIFVWLMPLKESSSGGINPFDYATPGGEPRSYQFPYSRPAHQMLASADQSIREGRPVVFERLEKRPPSGDEGEPGEEAEGEESVDGAVPGNGRPGGTPPPGGGEEFKVYELPAPSLPRKPK